MKIENYKLYTLILSYNADDVFNYYRVEKMHGLERGSTIHGWCNVSPFDGKPYVFINLNYCTDDIYTTGIVMHEMMHLSSYKYDQDWSSYEEEMISFAEIETYKIVNIIKNYKNLLG